MAPSHLYSHMINVTSKSCRIINISIAWHYRSVFPSHKHDGILPLLMTKSSLLISQWSVNKRLLFGIGTVRVLMPSAMETSRHGRIWFFNYTTNRFQHCISHSQWHWQPLNQITFYLKYTTYRHTNKSAWHFKISSTNSSNKHHIIMALVWPSVSPASSVKDKDNDLIMSISIQHRTIVSNIRANLRQMWNLCLHGFSCKFMHQIWGKTCRSLQNSHQDDFELRKDHWNPCVSFGWVSWIMKTCFTLKS